MGLGVDKSVRINGEYKIFEQIGIGGFSEVYKVIDRNGHERAAKFVNSDNQFVLRTESDAMISGGGHRSYGTCYKYYCGRHGHLYVLVMDLLGESLYDLRKRYGGLSTKSVLMLGIQMTTRVEQLHNRGYLHRDIKPDNFAVGRSGRDEEYVYLIDLGFAQRFRDHSHYHKPKSFGHSFIGTRTFASKQSHRGQRQSRRSDLESLVYSIIYLFRGRLPWKEESGRRTKKMKESMSHNDICNDVPSEIAKYLKYVRGLGHTDRPDYSKLRSYLLEALNRYGYQHDKDFEWN